MFSFMKSSGPRVERISASDAIAKASSGELTVIDVRDISEVRASGKAKGALHIPLMMIGTKADPKSPEHDKRLATDKPIAVYCASGARSQAAGGMLINMGYTQVYNIGGLGDWRAAGGVIAA